MVLPIDKVNISFGLPVPDNVGLLIPVTAVRVQLKMVPAVPLVGVYEKVELLQIAGGVSELVKVGIGFTTTITLYETGALQPVTNKV